MPLIVYDPRMPQAVRGKLDHSFTLNTDLAVTVLGAAGIKPPSTMQGRDLADLYLPPNQRQSDDPWRDSFYYEFPLREFPGSTAVITREWKYVVYYVNGYPGGIYEQLFNLKSDPYELKDRVKDPDLKDILKQLRAQHDKLQQEARQGKPGGPPPECKKGSAP